MTQSEEHILPRYLMLGTVTIAVCLLIAVAIHFLVKSEQDNVVRLAALEEQFIQRERDQLEIELHAAQDYIRYTLNQAKPVLEQHSRTEVLKAHAIATTIHQREHQHRPEAEVKELITEALRDVRFFNGRGYLFIDDLAGNCILLPTAPHIEGRSLIDNKDDTGHFIMRGLLGAVDNPQGEGYSEYRWYPPHNQREMADKLAFVKLFEPYDWIIGAGDYLYQIENDLQQQALKRLRSVRFGSHGYLAVFDKDGTLLSSPGVSTIEGEHHSLLRSEQEKKVVQSILATAKKGGGYTEYDWFFPNGEGPYRKISLVDVVPELGWILVAGFYPVDIEAMLNQQKQLLEQGQQEDRSTLYVFLTLATVATLTLSILFSQWLQFKFSEYQSEIRRKQAKLIENSHQLQLASRVFDSANEGIMVTSADNHLLAVNDAFVKITGFSPEDVLGRNPSFLSSGKHDELFYSQMWQAINHRGYWSGEIWNRRKNGEVFPQWLSITVSHDDHGGIRNYIASITDLSERKQVEEQLQYLADYDPLTNLPNRRLLGYRVEQTIALTKRSKQKQFALLYIDLDHFKTINDSLGHRFGDEILQKVAQRIQALTRESDTVSRLGGDEFIVLMPDLDELAQPTQLAERILHEVAQPLQSETHLTITPSIGIAVYPNDGDNFYKLLRNADAAVHFAKKQGRNNFQFYTDEMNQKASHRLQVEMALRQAIEKDEFELYYQPQFDLNVKQLAGCEALIRWQHPELGLVPPDSFIPLAEENGLILPIGSWVLRTACLQAAQWLAVSEQPFTISVNVSVRQFREELVDEVQAVLLESGLPAQNLILEITESILMQDQDKSAQLLHDLKLLGVQLSLDDFGTGYSSLAYLKGFNIDQLKIDRAFISGLPENRDDAAITSAIIDVANHFGLVTVAEGIETLDQAGFLADVGCAEGQGYLYEKPIPGSDVTERYFSS